MAPTARWIDTLLAPGAAGRITMLLTQLTEGLPGPVLDVGCGAQARVARTDLVGLDVDRASLLHFEGTGICADAAELPFRDGCFGVVLSVGLLHHLSDGQARRAIGEMLRVTVSGGTVVVFDGIWPTRPLGSPLATIIRRLDRGRHMRSVDGLSALLDEAGPWQKRMERYSHTGLEALLAVRRKV